MTIIKHGKTLGTAKVISNDLIPKGSAICGRKLQSISYITIHNTGNLDVKSNNYHRALKNQNALPNGRQASWTFTVDDVEIYQETPTDWETWHSGTSKGNKNSISIEVCMWSNKEKQRKSYDNTARLVAELMKMHKIPLSNIKQHYDWSGKDCPQFLRANKYGFNWKWFMDLVKKYYDNSNATVDATTKDFKRIAGTIQILSDTLNIRESASFNSKTVGTFKKGDTANVMGIENGLYKIKEGQWCSAGEKYVKFTESKGNVYEVNTNELNVRKGRGTNFDKVGVLKKGDRIDLWSIAKDDKGTDWGSFRYSFEPNIVGYVSLDFLKKV